MEVIPKERGKEREPMSVGDGEISDRSKYRRGGGRGVGRVGNMVTICRNDDGSIY